jgi:hypothetical protein
VTESAQVVTALRARETATRFVTELLEVCSLWPDHTVFDLEALHPALPPRRFTLGELRQAAEEREAA